MRKAVCGAFALGLLLALSGQVYAADAQTILEKAIKAAGGSDKLTPFTKEAFTWKSTVIVKTPDGDGKLTETGYAQGDQVRLEINGKFGDKEVKVVRVCDGNKCYVREGEKTEELDKEKAGHFKADWNRMRMCMLLEPLKDRALELTALDDAKVGDKAALGLKAVHKEHGTTQFFFDKDDGTLLKVTYRAFNPHDGKEHDYEMMTSAPKEMSGIRIPTKVSLKQDGKDYVEVELTEMKHVDKLDKKLFEKP
jgi:hypothetical protein